MVGGGGKKRVKRRRGSRGEGEGGGGGCRHWKGRREGCKGPCRKRER